MTKFKRGDMVREIDNHSCTDVVEWEYQKYWKLVEQTYTKLTPKVGDKFRVTKLKKHGSNPFRVGECITLVSDEGGCEKRWRGNNDTRLWHHDSDGNSVITTEYLEPVEEEQTLTDSAFTMTQGNVNDIMNQAMTAMDIASKPLFVTGRRLGKGMVEQNLKLQKILNKTKLTTMQKLTSALKRVLSADKQTLFKDEVIGQNLTLTTRGQSMYISALFDNDGDHKKAMEQLVADAQESLDEEKN